MKRDNFTLIHTTDGAPKFNNEAQVLTSSTGRMVAYGQMTHDEARRLAACWNACLGVSTKWLEESKSIVLLAEPISDRFKALELANCTMLEALQAISGGNLMAGKETWTTADVVLKHQKIARAAVASVNGGAS